MYSLYSKYYDELEGPQEKQAAFLLKLLENHEKNCKTLLELACGTGSLLVFLSKKYQIEGIDISPDMLEIAKNKLPNTTFYLANMVDFNMGKKYDIVLCVYDSINHLLSWEEWSDTFDNVWKHLNPGGLFVFDINTLHRLDFLAKQSPWLRQFNENYISMATVKNGSYYNFEIRIFEHLGEHKFLLLQEDIVETSFDIDKIEGRLAKQFHIETICNSKGEDIKQEDSRIYFLCRKKN